MRVKPIILILTILLFNCKTQNIPLYVGTYTSEDSEGIYQYQFNTETGELSGEKLSAETKDPSYIAFSPSKKFLYAVNEGDESVSSFEIKKEGNLKLLNTVSSNGKYPCHISVNNDGTKAVVSNYGGGNVALYSINSDGNLIEASQVFNHNAENQESHAHSAQFYKDNLYVSDLGRNSLYQYIKDKGDYKLKTPSIVKMNENDGPRHFALTKNGQFIYIINEYANTITVAKKVNDQFEILTIESTLSDEFNDDSFCADIHLSKDERFLYGSNRGENSIVVFKRDVKNGTITKIQNISTEGNWPRNFTLDPTGKFLLVANQKSNTISVFKIHPDSGTLSYLNSVKTPSPVCLLF